MKRTIRECDRHDKNDEVRADETIVFRVDDNWFEIDVCPEHVAEFRAYEQLQKAWVASAQPAVPPEPTQQRRHRATKPEVLENAAIRTWAKSIGIDLGSRGRIPIELRTRYHEEVGEQARDRWSASRRGLDEHVPVPSQ